MQYNEISADGHIDLIWLPEDLFTSNASARLRSRQMTDRHVWSVWR